MSQTRRTFGSLWRNTIVHYDLSPENEKTRASWNWPDEDVIVCSVAISSDNRLVAIGATAPYGSTHRGEVRLFRMDAIRDK